MWSDWYGQKTKKIGRGSKVPSKPSPSRFLDMVGSWTEAEAEVVGMSEAAFLRISQGFLSSTNEVGGYFLVQDGMVVWATKALTGQSSASVSGDKEYSVACAKCLEECGVAPNGQWHSHPGFGTHWSSTDLNDQGRTVETAMKFSPQGEMYFLCVDGLEFLARKVWWQEGKVSFSDFTPELWDGTPMIESRSLIPLKHYGWIGKNVTFPYEGKTLEGKVIRWNKKKAAYDVDTDDDGFYHVPSSLLEEIKAPKPTDDVVGKRVRFEVQPGGPMVGTITQFYDDHLGTEFEVLVYDEEDWPHYFVVGLDEVEFVKDADDLLDNFQVGQQVRFNNDKGVQITAWVVGIDKAEGVIDVVDEDNFGWSLYPDEVIDGSWYDYSPKEVA